MRPKNPLFDRHSRPFHRHSRPFHCHPRESGNPAPARLKPEYPPFPLARALAALGFASIFPYAYALHLPSLRAHTVEFEFAFFAAFGLYLAAVALVLHPGRPASAKVVAVVLGFAIAYRSLLVFSPPSLSDDMYRYVWDGRVQANQVNPYVYPPNAPELSHLRDDAVWPLINRKVAVTVYPGGAELTYAALWRLWPDNVRWFQIVMASGGLVAGVILIWLLKALGRPPHLVLIYLWNPLVVFETAHSAHVDGLVLPLLVGAWLARAKERDILVGLLLGAATALKLYPAVLLPALWRPSRAPRGFLAASAMPLAFAAVLASSYIPYISQGLGVVGFLPTYLNERFNGSPVAVLLDVAERAPRELDPVRTWAAPAVLIIITLVFVARPVSNAEQAIRRCAWPIGAFILTTQNLHPWYALWLVPLLALYVRPGRMGLRLDAWTGWLLFSGLVALAYTFFVNLEPVPWVRYVEFLPLYALLTRR